MSRSEKHSAKRDYRRLFTGRLGSVRQRVARFLFATLPGLRLSQCPLYCQLRLTQQHGQIQTLTSLP